MTDNTTTPEPPLDPSETADAGDTALTRSALDFPVVGLGASAGGLQALIRFFENAPADMGMAFVAVLHLSPNHVSTADEVLRRATRMRVVQVSGPVRIEPNHVYVIAPAKSLTMIDGHLRVRDAAPSGGRPVTIDTFFRSLADAHGQHAMSIVLSGTGSDGAVGLARVKEVGGITFAQEPNDAEYGEMPQSAIATGQVDLVLPVVEMPQKLLDLWANAKRISLPALEPRTAKAAPGTDPGAHAEAALQDILTSLRARTGHDFRHYKRATMLRRIERRLQVNALPDLVTYRDFLHGNPRETGALLADMLIGVTNFFRDREAFEAFARDVLPDIYERKRDHDQVRVWVAGCSSGEEAYTLAMLFTEYQNAARSPAALQVFATDIDETAVAKARTGVYPDSIVTDVPPDILRQFFAKSASRYEVLKPVREKILFALHNVLRDPPFSRLDVVSCRNLLIYLDRTVQRQVLEMFHFALYPNGYLFLGSSESADSVEDLFSVVDKKHRIYRAKAVAHPRRPSMMPPARAGEPAQPAVADPASALIPARRNFSFSALHQRVLEQYAPPSIIVNRDSKIVHMSENVGRFLRYVGGEPSSNVIALVLPELRLDLRTALFQALQTGNSVEARRVRLVRDERPCYVTMTVRPFHDADADADFVLVLFDEVQEAMTDGPPTTDQIGADTVLMQLEREVQRSKEQLQRTIEQYETSTEELKASNEELQAINEELRSATEELETSKEELQSVNEELVTVNSELQSKIEETGKANDDLQNLIASSDIATIFVDRAMRVKRYTPSATGVFNLIGADVGRSLFDITHRLHYPELAEDVAATFQSLRLIERQVASRDERWFIARLLPYRTGDDRIDGAVLTLIDITARRRAEEEAREGAERLRLAAQTTNDYAIIVQDPEGVIQSWNAGAERVFGYTESEAVGRNIEIIFSAEDRAQGVAARERETAAAEGRADDERWHVAKSGRQVFCSGVVTPLSDPKFTGFAKIARDLTDRKSVEDLRQVQLSQERLVRERAEAANRLKDDFLAVLSHELKHPLNLINVKAQMLPRLPESRGAPAIVEAADAIQRAVLSQAQIIDDLLDLSRVRTGKLALTLALTDLAPTLASICDAMEGDAAARGVALSLTAAAQPALAKVDPVRFEQIVWNLLSNALKFTPAGGKVTIGLTRDGADLCIEVADTGEGIEPEFLPHIFDMFSQANEARRKSGVGLGIGLALVKQLVEMHAGRVAVRSDGHGKGTCITVWLPPASDDAALPGALPGESSVLAGLSLLVVDDDAETGHALGSLLTLEGARVATATNGAEALAALGRERYDLLVCDVGMPVMDGYQLMREVRSTSVLAGLPAVAVTGYSGVAQEQKTFDAGFDAHLTKPVSLAALIGAVEQVMLKRPASA
ncbi:CheR family methyltransferase [Caballeronia telluris]|uniref:histidine kinase n=1 Tax=Caballeronia telluris TaxID=326475 RepID=A0A158F2B5_9BURK|nr:chemotaxis protein [Caballeronia telluris]